MWVIVSNPSEFAARLVAEVDEVILKSRPINIGSLQLVYLRNLAVVLGRGWYHLSRQLPNQGVCGIRVGWHWWATTDEVRRWLLAFPVMLKRANNWDESQLTLVPYEPLIIVDQGQQFITPIDLCKSLLLRDFDQLKAWLLKYNVQVVSQEGRGVVIGVASLGLALDSAPLDDQKRRRLKALACPHCRGTGYLEGGDCPHCDSGLRPV